MTHTKANKSKVLAIILGLTMCLALMLGIVFASPTSTVYAEGETLTPYDRIYINNKPLNNGYYLKTSDGDQLNGDPTSGYVAKYKDGVLTLNNFNGGYVGINPAVSGYFTINLIGDNIITGGQNGVFIDGEHEGRVTITSNANGKLTINASSDISVWGIACGASVMAKNIDVVIGGNAQVTINATSSGKYKTVEGIHARNVTIKDNASVKITAKNTNNETESNWVKGIFAKEKVTINTTGNIDIDATMAGGTGAYSYGIQAQGSTTFTKVGNMTIKYKKAGNNGWPITGGDVDNTTHAVNEYSISNINFASYRYGTPRYVAAINGTLAGPGVPKEANRGSGYFLAGDLVTLNAPSLQVSETDTTNIPFDKWFSFVSDAVITNATSQNGAKLTVQDKDIEVRANYNAFTAQPVFERESGTEGTVTFTLISNEFNQNRWLNIRPINDLTISKGNVISVGGTTYNATLSDTGTVYGTPAGEYLVEVEYNNRTLYSAPFTVDYTERKATIGNVIPPIVDEELFYECNVIMDNHKHKPRDSKSEQPYILSGKLFCGFCGSLMTAETGTSHTGKLHHYYKCFGRKRNKHSCKKANYRQQDLEDLVFGTTVKYVLQPDVIQTVAEQVVSKFNSEITKSATLENLENELKAKEKAINALLAAIEQGIVTKSTKERLISLETQKEELENKILLEKARQIKPLEVDKVKAFLTYFARKKYENGQEKNKFFNSFINRVILYDDKILIFYNTDDNHPTVIKRKDTEEFISHLNDIASNGKTATNDCPNATGNNSPVVQNKNSLEPQGFKRVSLGGAFVT